MQLRYIPKDYQPKGDLKDFPLEIIDKMLLTQLELGSKLDLGLLEADVRQGFHWRSSREGFNFWRDIIELKKFDTFFKIYPRMESRVWKTNKLLVGRLMEFWHFACDDWKEKIRNYLQRVDNQGYISFTDEEIEEAYNEVVKRQAEAKSLFILYFGEKPIPIEKDKIKIGTRFLINQSIYHRIEGIDLDKPVTIVMLNQKHYINDRRHLDYCDAETITIWQNGNFNFIIPGDSLLFIDKIIEY